MAERETPGKPAPQKGPVAREDRLKKALKANMARRKAQARARAASDADTETEQAPEGAKTDKEI